MPPYTFDSAGWFNGFAQRILSVDRKKHSTRRRVFENWPATPIRFEVRYDPIVRIRSPCRLFRIAEGADTIEFPSTVPLNVCRSLRNPEVLL